MSKLTRYAALIVSVMATFYLLIIGKGFLMPLVLALLTWYLLSSLISAFVRLKFPRFVAVLSALISCGVALGALALLIRMNYSEVLLALPDYQLKFAALLDQLQSSFGFDLAVFLEDSLAAINFSELFTGVGGALRTVAGSSILILIYVIFFFLEQRSVSEKLPLIFSKRGQMKNVQKILGDIQTRINTYFKIKTFTSLMTGILSTLVLAVIGVDFALFWGVLIFLLNYIPTVGSIIAVIFPMLLTLIQFDTLLPFAITAAALIGIQFAIGNVLEPRLMGSSLNLSPLVILLALGLWGLVWGVMGMILSVPIMVILSSIFAEFESTRPLAIIFSADGNISATRR